MFSRKVKHETSSKVPVFLPIFKSSHFPINMFKLQKRSVCTASMFVGMQLVEGMGSWSVYLYSTLQGTRKHIPPNGKLGKSSSQKCRFTVGVHRFIDSLSCCFKKQIPYWLDSTSDSDFYRDSPKAVHNVRCFWHTKSTAIPLSMTMNCIDFGKRWGVYRLSERDHRKVTG